MKDCFASAEETVHQNGKLFIGSLDMNSLFTNIPLEESTIICTNLLCNNVDVKKGINKSEFENLLSFATKGILFYVYRYSLQVKGRCSHEIALRTYYGRCFFIVL